MSSRSRSRCPQWVPVTIDNLTTLVACHVDEHRS